MPKTYCSNCDVEIRFYDEDDLNYIEGEVYCDSCYDELKDELTPYSSQQCPYCNIAYVREGGLVWCPNCQYEP